MFFQSFLCDNVNGYNEYWLISDVERWRGIRKEMVVVAAIVVVINVFIPNDR